MREIPRPLLIGGSVAVIAIGVVVGAVAGRRRANAPAPPPAPTYDPRLPPDSGHHPEARTGHLYHRGASKVVVFPSAVSLETYMSGIDKMSTDEGAMLLGKLHAALVPNGQRVSVLETSPTWTQVALTVDGVSATGYVLPILVDIDPVPECKLGTSKLRWGCPMSPHNPMAFSTFKATSVEAPTVFRVSGRLSDYYNYEYGSAQKTHYSVEVRDGGDYAPEKTLHAYIARKDPTAGALFDLLKDGEAHTITVELAFNKNSRTTDITKITRFVCAGWLCKP